MVRQLRPGCSIPTDCGATRTTASVLRVTTHATARWLPELSRKGGSASCDSKVTDEGMRAVRAHVDPRGTTRRFEQRSLLHHLQVRGEATVRFTGLQGA
jgi:hypothetical protein